MIIDQLFDIITSSEVIPRLTRSSFTRDKFNSVYDTNYTEFVYEQDEILIFKDTYLKIFVESYKAQNIYGLIITTNDNHKIMNQFQVPNDLEMLMKEYKFTSCLLMSNMSKINKNSLLWLYLKKLVIKLEGNVEGVIETVLTSASQHKNNYYCWEFLRWFLNYQLIHNQVIIKIKDIKSFCFSNVKDHSAWQFLSYYVSLKQIDPYYYNSYKKISLEIEIIPQLYDDRLLQFDLGVDDIIEFIKSSNSTSWIPYQFLLSFPKFLDTKFFASVKTFETKYQGDIILENGFYKFSKVYDEKDLKFVEDLTINGNKKRLLKWISIKGIEINII